MAPLPPPMPACAPPRSSPTRERERIPRGAVRDAPTMIALGKRFLKEYVSHPLQAEHGRGIPPLSPSCSLIPGSAGTGCPIFRGAISRRSITICATRPIRPTAHLGFCPRCSIWRSYGISAPTGTNPCRHVKRFREEKRERFLSDIEYQRLGAALKAIEADGSETASAIAAVRLLMLTGCRLSEIQKLRWEHVDLGASELRLPDTKTGAKVVYLGDPAIAVLERIDRRDGNPWVIAGRKPGGHLTDLQHPWRRIRARAGLDDVRIHDLRHSFASGGLLVGEGLPMIGKLLGHTQVQTTARYAHLANDPVKSAANRIASRIAEVSG